MDLNQTIPYTYGNPLSYGQMTNTRYHPYPNNGHYNRLQNANPYYNTYFYNQFPPNSYRMPYSGNGNYYYYYSQPKSYPRPNYPMVQQQNAGERSYQYANYVRIPAPPPYPSQFNNNQLMSNQQPLAIMPPTSSYSEVVPNLIQSQVNDDIRSVSISRDSGIGSIANGLSPVERLNEVKSEFHDDPIAEAMTQLGIDPGTAKNELESDPVIHPIGTQPNSVPSIESNLMNLINNIASDSQSTTATVAAMPCKDRSAPLALCTNHCFLCGQKFRCQRQNHMRQHLKSMLLDQEPSSPLLTMWLVGQHPNVLQRNPLCQICNNSMCLTKTSITHHIANKHSELRGIPAKDKRDLCFPLWSSDQLEKYGFNLDQYDNQNHSHVPAQSQEIPCSSNVFTPIPQAPLAQSQQLPFTITSGRVSPPVAPQVSPVKRFKSRIIGETRLMIRRSTSQNPQNGVTDSIMLVQRTEHETNVNSESGEPNLEPSTADFDLLDRLERHFEQNSFAGTGVVDERLSESPDSVDGRLIIDEPNEDDSPGLVIEEIIEEDENRSESTPKLEDKAHSFRSQTIVDVTGLSSIYDQRSPSPVIGDQNETDSSTAILLRRLQEIPPRLEYYGEDGEFLRRMTSADADCAVKECLFKDYDEFCSKGMTAGEKVEYQLAKLSIKTEDAYLWFEQYYNFDGVDFRQQK